MTSQFELFRPCERLDAEAGATAREEAIERVATPIPAQEWIAHAVGVIARLARTRDRFTTDDVWMAVEYRPPEPRAMGAAMRQAKALGLVVAMNEYVLSKRPCCHRRPVRVWRAVRA